MRFFVVLLSLSIVPYGTPVLAEDGARDGAVAMPEGRFEFESPWPSRPIDVLLAQAPKKALEGIEQSGLDARIDELQRERSQVSTRGPGAAAIVGGVMTGVGVVVAGAAALSCNYWNSRSDTTCDQNRARAFGIGGGIIAAIGLVTMIGGLSTLSSRRRQLREFDREILELQHARASLLPSNLSAGVNLGETTGLTLSWEF